MINLAVINIKDVIKILKILIISIIIILIISKLGVSFAKNKEFPFRNINTSEVINQTILLSNYSENSKQKESGLKRLLISELAIFSEEEKLMEIENQEEVLEFDDLKESNLPITKTNEENLEDNSSGIENNRNIAFSLPTKVISENNKNDTFTNAYNSVKIKNESDYNLTQDMIIPNVEFVNKRDVIIYHTHTCESYTPTENSNYVSTGNFRTTDLNFSVARVGTELANNLNNMGFNVIHDTSYHDYPAYTGSYTRSLATINKILGENPNSEFVIDLHRDAIGSSSSYGPTVQIGDEIAAQIMFVIGTDGGGLEHTNWINNFKLAIKIQEQANLMYPGLFKPIILRN